MSLISTPGESSMEPILQDCSVSSLSNPDILPPSDSSFLEEIQNYELVMPNLSCSHPVSSASYPSDSSFMKEIQNYEVVNKSQEPLFKKLLNRPTKKHKRKPTPSLLDSGMKGSEQDTLEKKVCRPFQRQKTSESASYTSGSSLTEKFQNKSQEPLFKKPLNTKKYKRKPIPNLFDSDVKDSEPDTPEQKVRRPFQRQKVSDAKTFSSVFDDILDQPSDNSLSKSSPEKMNFITRNKTRLKVPLNSKLFDSDVLTSENDESFSLKPAFKSHTVNQKVPLNSKLFDLDVLTSESDESFSIKPAFKSRKVNQEVKNSTFFDDVLDTSDNRTISKTKSPSLKRIPFQTSKRTPLKEPPTFDSLLNESLNTSENNESVYHDILSKKIDKKQAECSINFDDVVNNTCDGSSLMSNSLVLKDKSFNKEEKTLPEKKTNTSIGSLPLTLNSQVRLDISDKIEEFNMNLSLTSEVNNKSKMAVLFSDDTPELGNNESVVHENIEEYEVSPSELTKDLSLDETTKKENSALADQEQCAQLSYFEQNHSLESKKTPSKLILIKEVDSGLKNCAEPNTSQICSNYDTNLTCTDQDNQTVSLSKSKLNHTVPKDNNKGNSSVKDYSSENLLNPELNMETLNNKSILKQSRITFNISETKEHTETNYVHKKPSLKRDSGDSISKVHGLNENLNQHVDSESRYYECNEDDNTLSKSAGENKSITRLREIKKQSVKRVSFKLRNEGEERKSSRKSDRNSAFSNTDLEEKSFSGCNYSKVSNSSCSLESLVLDGSSSETTSGSVFIDLCASRNKSSSVNMNLEGNGYQAVNVNKKSIAVQLQSEEIVETQGEQEEGQNMDEDSLEDLDNKLESGFEEDERENVEIEDLDNEEGKITGESEDEDSGEDEKENEVDLDNEEGKITGECEDEDSGEDDKENEVDNHSDESCTTTKSSLSERDAQYQTDEYPEENENSPLCLINKELKNRSNLPLNKYKYTFKKPGPCTVLNEKMSTPPTKRKVQEMLAKIPLSEFKSKKPRSVSVDQTKEQMEQDKIEETLRKRQKQSSVRSKRAPKITKPKYMFPKVYDFIVEKLTPTFGLKSRIEAESVVIFLNEQGDVIMKNDNRLVQAVQEMKMKLAKLKVIHTHWEFYRFIMKYGDGYFKQKVYPSGVTSPFEPDDPFQNICE